MKKMIFILIVFCMSAVACFGGYCYCYKVSIVNGVRDITGSYEPPDPNGTPLFIGESPYTMIFHEYEIVL